VKNITVSVNDDLYRKARLVAAENDTSVSALVRTHLESLVAANSVDPWQKRREKLATAFGKIEHRHGKKIGKLKREELYAERLKLR
jgi:hypothetical protein